MGSHRTPIEILMVEDNPADIRLAQEAFKEARIVNRMTAVHSGHAAIDFLRRQGQFERVKRPDLIVLDLNLPRKNGREVLAEIKGDPALKRIPVVVLSTSKATQDITQAYNLHANCYVVKPVDFEQFTDAIRSIEQFWLSTAALPPH